MLTKNEQIKASILATREKRKSQECRVFRVKVVENKLNSVQREALKMLFVEAKWIANELIAFLRDGGELSSYKVGSSVKHKNKDGENIETPISFLSSQMKQSVHEDLRANLQGLGVLKEHGRKVGELRFRSDYNSINLKQANVTYKLKGERVKIQGIKKPILVRGLHQIPEDAELANAHILNTPRGYFIAITTFIPKEEPKNLINEEIGIDMGIKTSLTLSNGKSYHAMIGEGERLKTLQRQLERKKKGSNNRRKHVAKIQREYQRLTNRKNDVANKIVHDLKQYKRVVIQDEMISGWHKGLFGKQVQHSVLGRVKAKLAAASKSNPERFIVIARKHPTTKRCSGCGVLKEIDLKERTYVCESCGLVINRDLNSALNILQIGVERTELTPVERVVGPSLKQEAARSLASQ